MKTNHMGNIVEVINNVIKEMLGENFNDSEIQITNIEPDERSSMQNNNVSYHVNYQKLINGTPVEIEGKITPYNSGRAIEYKFEPNHFTDINSEQYWDMNWETIEDEIINKFYNT